MTTKKNIVAVEWRLYPVMAARKIRKATELRRMLEDIGLDISSTHLSRMVSGEPQRLNLETLAALMTVLDCDASDLIHRVDRPEKDRGIETRDEISVPSRGDVKPPRALNKPETRKPVAAAEEIKKVAGPKVHPFPPPKPKGKKSE